MKMLTAYHPETDGVSERSNKTIVQMLHYHVHQNQKGWVHALPHICFQIMNTVNASTGFSGFQLHLSCSPRALPLIIPNTVPIELQDAADNANILIQQLKDDIAEARDNLLLTKVTQAHYANTTWGPDPQYKEGDLVMLLTTNQRHK
jgi:hypothetical protein